MKWLAVILLVSSTAWAGPNEDLILREAGVVAGRTYAEGLAREYLTKKRDESSRPGKRQKLRRQDPRSCGDWIVGQRLFPREE